MNVQDQTILADFIDQVSALRLNQSTRLGPALKKPLLLLLLLATIERGKCPNNRFSFGDLRSELASLIESYGGRPVRSGAKPEQPFSHLRSAAFWNLTTQQTYAQGQTVLVSDLMDSRSFGSFEPRTFSVLANSKEARYRAIGAILELWWPDTLHEEILAALHIAPVPSRGRVRSRLFVAEVLENYRFSCAVCGFHAILNGRSVGVDAGHVQWHSAAGPDDIENGIALCKLHHWAFDKGIMTLDKRLIIRVASAFVVRVDGGLPIESLEGCKLSVLPRDVGPSESYLEWHHRNVYLGDKNGAS